MLLRQVINVIDELDLSDYEEATPSTKSTRAFSKELQSAGPRASLHAPRRDRLHGEG